MDVKKALEEYLAKPGRFQAQVGRAIGRSASVISQYLKGAYPGNVKELEAKVKAFLARESERCEAPKRPKFVMTSIAKEIYTVLRVAHIDGCIGIVYGPAGTGKTMALRNYTAQNRDVILITCDASFTMKGIAEELAEKLEVLARGPVRETVRRNVRALAGSGRLVIVDEAQFLPHKAIEVLRKIHDEAGVGLVLSGMTRLYNQMMGRGLELFAQLFSRVGIRRYVGEITKEDIAKIVEQVIPKGSDGIVPWLYEKALVPGGIRIAMQNLMVAQRMANTERIKLTIEVLQEAEKLLMI